MALGAFAPLPLRLGGTPEEGMTPAQYTRAANDLTAVRRVAPFARMVIDPNSGSPQILSYRGQNGVGTLDWPAVSFAASRVVLTFATSYPDDLGIYSKVHLIAAQGRVRGTPGFVLVEDITQRNVVKAIATDVGLSVNTALAFSLVIYSQ